LGGDGAWQAARFDLTSHRGQTVVVYFNTYNDGDGRRSWMHVDDVRLDVCTP
jgi:bacillopeptidase F (M6 metalloprotease family)